MFIISGHTSAALPKINIRKNNKRLLGERQLNSVTPLPLCLSFEISLWQRTSRHSCEAPGLGDRWRSFVMSHCHVSVFGISKGPGRAEDISTHAS